MSQPASPQPAPSRPPTSEQPAPSQPPRLTELPLWCADVLRTFKAEHGRQWKRKLWDLFASGQDEHARTKARSHEHPWGAPIGSTLRQVRNHPMRDQILDLV